MDKDSRKNGDKIMTEARRFSYSRKKKYSRSNSQYSRTGSSFLSAAISNQPPSGKRALLCCVSYKKQKVELKGTKHDLKNMRNLLVEQFRFPDNSILILAEDEPYLPPTKKNIEDAFQWLLRGIQRGDSLVFYFSGHGLRERNLNGEEIDGFDETICPSDFQTIGMISDDYINEKIVKPLVPGVTLHAIVDSCHSGTVLDLPYVYNLNTEKWDDNLTQSPELKGTKGGKAISISACEDYQVAADTSAFQKEMTGAMTSSFIRAVEEALAKNRKITYREILDRMNEYLNQTEKVGCIGLRRAFRRKIFQVSLAIRPSQDISFIYHHIDMSEKLQYAVPEFLDHFSILIWRVAHDRGKIAIFEHNR